MSRKRLLLTLLISLIGICGYNVNAARILNINRESQLPDISQIVYPEMPDHQNNKSCYTTKCNSKIREICQQHNLKLTKDVKITFIIDGGGRVIDPQVTQEGYYRIDEEVLNILRSCHDIRPGEINGKAGYFICNYTLSYFTAVHQFEWTPLLTPEKSDIPE